MTRRNNRRAPKKEQGPRNYRDPFNKKFSKFFASVRKAWVHDDVHPRVHNVVKRAMVEA
jgi:hypothetical protein